MSEERGGTINDEDRTFQHKVLDEFKEIRDKPLPDINEDWDLIWVLSGPENTFEENPENNETRERLVTGFNLVKGVTAKRLGKGVNEVTLEDIAAHGPKIYFAGLANGHHPALQKTAESGILEDKYGFPRENLINDKVEEIAYTGHQFQYFPENLLERSRKIVIVTSPRHIPRVKRYSRDERYSISQKGEDLILYPALPLKFPVGGTLREIRNISKYVREGVLPPEK